MVEVRCARKTMHRCLAAPRGNGLLPDVHVSGVPAAPWRRQSNEDDSRSGKRFGVQAGSSWFELVRAHDRAWTIRNLSRSDRV